MKCRVRMMKGGFSGGTAASLKATLAAAARDPRIVALLTNPFALTPGFSGPHQPTGFDRFCVVRFAREHPRLGSGWRRWPQRAVFGNGGLRGIPCPLPGYEPA